MLIEYARAVDAREWARIGACFTASATASYGGNELPPGRDAIVDYIRSRTAAHTSSMHMVSNVSVSLDGDTAQAHSYTLATLLVDQGRTLLTRGVSYDDALVLVRSADGADGGGAWQITRRVHRVHWMTEQSAVTPR